MLVETLEYQLTYEFSDAKALFSTGVGGGDLLLANTELSGEVRPFNLGDEFNIGSVSGSGLKSNWNNDLCWCC